MDNAFDLNSGEPGTIAPECLTEGPNRCPSGIPFKNYWHLFLTLDSNLVWGFLSKTKNIYEMLF
jgi:hypothetical protein